MSSYKKLSITATPIFFEIVKFVVVTDKEIYLFRINRTSQMILQLQPTMNVGLQSISSYIFSR
jgi:hypothetical protein